jgi:hypothetical protein
MILLVLGAIAAVVGIISSFSPLRATPLVGQIIGLAFNMLILMYLLDPQVKQAFMPGCVAAC